MSLYRPLNSLGGFTFVIDKKSLFSRPCQTLMRGQPATLNVLPCAFNDAGIILLPNKHRIFLVVFVSDSTDDMKNCESTIAKIARAAWDKWK